MTIEVRVSNAAKVVVSDMMDGMTRLVDIRKWMLYPEGDAFYPTRSGIRIRATAWPRVAEAVKQLLEEPNKPIDKP